MRRPLPVVLTAVLLAAGLYLAGQRWAARDRRPRCPGCNVLLVTFDALRADHLGVYGYARDTSPAIDRFAARSSVFTRNLSQSGTTVSSLPSLFVSKFPHTDELLDEGVLPPSELTLAEILRSAGYATIAVIAHEFAECAWGVCQGMETVDEDYVPPESAADTRARVVRALDQRRGEPFFLWAHFRHPHAPYDPPRAVFEEFYRPRAQQPTFYSDLECSPSFFKRLRCLVGHHAARGERVTTVQLYGKVKQVTPTIVEQLVAMYDGNIREVDREFGALIEHLRELGLSERTVVVVAADHGEAMGEHRLFDHNKLFYGILHTPLIVFVPGAAPRVLDHLVMNVDILPTVLETLELEVPERIRGSNAFRERSPRAYQFAEYEKSRTVVRGNFKLVVGESMRHRGVGLFDILEDPSETVDLSPSLPEVRDELLGLVAEIRSRSLAIEPAARDTEILERLRALGYIEQ